MCVCFEKPSKGFGPDGDITWLPRVSVSPRWEEGGPFGGWCSLLIGMEVQGWEENGRLFRRFGQEDFQKSTRCGM